MGALGCSEGPGPSSVVWACSLPETKHANAKAEIARLNLNRLFIETSGTMPVPHAIARILIALGLKQMQCQTLGDDRTINPFVYSNIACAGGIRASWGFKPVAARGQGGGFRPMR
jgi:hypothetical protein